MVCAGVEEGGPGSLGLGKLQRGTPGGLCRWEPAGGALGKDPGQPAEESPGCQAVAEFTRVTLSPEGVLM